MQLLFPGGSLDDAELMYQLSPLARFYNSLAGEAVAAAVADLPAGQRLRVLEIGAGTGGTTSAVLARLPADQLEYTFTDVSAHFLGRARRKFAELGCVDYRTLDIEGDLTAQGFAGQRFDIVVAANVLHATADLRHTFANVARLLAPSGLLAMVEMVRSQRFISISFGLTDGWWKFTDTDLRPTSLLLSGDGWREFLAGQGFGEPCTVPAVAADVPSSMAVQSLILASAPGITAADSLLPAGRRSWLILADADGAGARLADLIVGRGGSAVLATTGATYRATGPGRFELDPTSPQDFARLLVDVAGSGLDGIVHMWSLGHSGRSADVERTAQLRLGSALCLTQALANSGLTARLWFVTRGAQPAGEIAPDAEQAPLWGFAKSVALEHPELHPVCIDLDPSSAADVAGDLLAALVASGGEDQLAVRGGERLAARLVRAGRVVPAPTAAVELAFGDRGTLDDLAVRPAQRRSPGPGEVEIRVHATGLNFKDVLNVLGMYPGDPGPIGGECAGVVVAVGADVAELEVGDAVVAVAPGSFRSHVTCPAVFVVPKPPGLELRRGRRSADRQHHGRVRPPSRRPRRGGRAGADPRGGRRRRSRCRIARPASRRRGLRDGRQRRQAGLPRRARRRSRLRLALARLRGPDHGRHRRRRRRRRAQLTRRRGCRSQSRPAAAGRPLPRDRQARPPGRRGHRPAGSGVGATTSSTGARPRSTNHS